MPKILEKQIGPFKAWQWALMLLAGVIVGLYLRSRSTAAPGGESGEAVGSDSLPGGHSQLGAIGVPFAQGGGEDFGDFDFLLETQSEIFANAFEAQQQQFQQQLDETFDFFSRESLFGTRETVATDLTFKTNEDVTSPSFDGTVYTPQETPETQVGWILRSINGGPVLGTFGTRAACAAASGGDTSLGCYRVTS